MEKLSEAIAEAVGEYLKEDEVDPGFVSNWFLGFTVSGVNCEGEAYEMTDYFASEGSVTSTMGTIVLSTKKWEEDQE